MDKRVYDAETYEFLIKHAGIGNDNRPTPTVPNVITIHGYEGPNELFVKKERAEAAADAYLASYLQGVSPVVIPTGGPCVDGKPDARKLSDPFLRRLGVLEYSGPEPKIIYEEKARTTSQNATFVLERLVENGIVDFDSMACFSSPKIHVDPRVLWIYQVVFGPIVPEDFRFYGVFPKNSALDKNMRFATREFLSRVNNSIVSDLVSRFISPDFANEKLQVYGHNFLFPNLKELQEEFIKLRNYRENQTQVGEAIDTYV